MSILPRPANSDEPIIASWTPNQKVLEWLNRLAQPGLAFDLLSLDGQPLLDQPYTARRALLEQLELNGRHWQTPPSFTEAAGAELLEVSKQHNAPIAVSEDLYRAAALPGTAAEHGLGEAVEIDIRGRPHPVSVRLGGLDAGRA